MLHKTVRISSSASVGLGGPIAIYEDFTSKDFVCQMLFEPLRAGISTNTRMVAITGRILAPISTGSNENRSDTLPITSVERIVPTPAAAPLMPLTVATALPAYRAAGNV